MISRSFILLSVLAGCTVLAALPLGCKSQNSPMNPLFQINTPTHTPTVTATPTPAINWYMSGVGRCTSIQAGVTATPTVYSSAYLDILVNGSPVSTANVYLTGTNLSAPITCPYYGLSHSGGLDYAHYETYNSFTYATQETYTLTCEAMGVTTWATQAAPGDISALWDSGGAVTFISWAVDGDSDWMHILDASLSPVTIMWPDLDSPVTLDPSAPYPAPGQYIVEFRARNYTQAVTNAVSGSNYNVQDVLQRYFIKP
jgi:hypothetical protein